MDYYDHATLKKIIKRSASLLNVGINEEGAGEIARRSRGTPRIANALLRRVRDFAQIKGNGSIDLEISKYAIKALNVDENGLDEMDNKILSAIIDKFSGDDDLFINKVATKRNTEIVISPDAFTYSPPKETREEWIEQKTRHMSTARYYRAKHKYW